MTKLTKHHSSFKDPSGFIFIDNNTIYREIYTSYQTNYDLLISTGLYEYLTNNKMLVSHTEELQKTKSKNTYKIIKPLQIPFISYPYEWSFSQLKSAAILTLHIQKAALAYNLSLKDANAYNIQFLGSQPIFIDTTSFETYIPEPWIAYKQFCEHFLVPLFLAAKIDQNLLELQKSFLDGIPLELARKLLPLSSSLNLGALFHIILHSKSQKAHQNDASPSIYKLSKAKLLGLLDNLENTISKLNIASKPTTWSNYYQNTNYNPTSFTNKLTIVNNFITSTKPSIIFDLGSNNGEFSRLASSKSIPTISIDSDRMAVENNFTISRSNSDNYLLPIYSNLANPPSDLGWLNSERSSLLNRLSSHPKSATLALALVHHLVITHNIPLLTIAEFMSKISHELCIEFIPKSDSNVERLLINRKDVFPNYSEDGFSNAFNHYFKTIQRIEIPDSERVIYIMKNKTK